METRLALVCALTVSVMAPLVWAASDLRQTPLQLGTQENSLSQSGEGQSVTTKKLPKLKLLSTNTSFSEKRSKAVGTSDGPKPELIVKSIAGPPTPMPEPQVAQSPKPALDGAQYRNIEIPAPFFAEANCTPPENATVSTNTSRASKKNFRTIYTNRRRLEGQTNAFDVIDVYTGPHIIIICSKLTPAEKWRVGCL